jgi:hypothetical protein
MQLASRFTISSAARALASVALAAALNPASAAEIATDPGDYTGLPSGTMLGILYYQHTERDAYYAAGQRASAPFKLQTDIGIGRYVHYTTMGSYLVTPQVVVPFGQVDLRTPFGPIGSSSASGTGDPIVGSALWLVNRPDQLRYWTVSAFASLPLGSYHGARGPVNLGENRYKGIFQSAYLTPLAKNILLDLVAEYAVYGANDDFLGLRRKQRSTYGVQGHLRYMLSPGTALALTYYHDFGGETLLDGVAQQDRQNNQRLQIGLGSFISPSLQLQIQAGKSFRTENGARESSRINLRLVKVL